MREGRPVAVHYGSAAAELAVCVRAVGLVDRSELSTLSLEAPPAQLAALMTRLVGATVAHGGLVAGAGAWWCGVSADQVTVVSDERTAGRLTDALHADAARHVAVRDQSRQLAAIALLGRGHAAGAERTRRIRAIRRCPPRQAVQRRGAVDGLPAWWLLPSDRRALVLVGRDQAGAAWLAIEQAGRPFGISCVGHEAACRYALMERRRPATPVHV